MNIVAWEHLLRYVVLIKSLFRPSTRAEEALGQQLRWQDGVEAFSIKAGISDWQTKARDRERFRTLLRQAKTAKRLQRLIRKKVSCLNSV